MKKRNPLFVAGFPYGAIFVGYLGLVTSDFGQEASSNSLSSLNVVMLLVFMCFLLAGAAYSLYWLISTARGLRAQINQSIPHGILLIIPFANYLWMWRYSKAVEQYTDGKQQAALVFVVIAALGVIGMAILQDMFNKQMIQKPTLPNN